MTEPERAHKVQQLASLKLTEAIVADRIANAQCALADQLDAQASIKLTQVRVLEWSHNG